MYNYTYLKKEPFSVFHEDQCYSLLGVVEVFPEMTPTAGREHWMQLKTSLLSFKVRRELC